MDWEAPQIVLMRTSQLTWYPRNGNTRMVGFAKLGPELPGEFIEVQVYGRWILPDFDTPMYARDPLGMLDVKRV